MNKKLYRSRKNKMIGGVCGGLGEYFEVDPVLIRILFVFLTFFHGSGLILYILLMIIVPQEPIVFNEETNNSSSESEISEEDISIKTNAKKGNTKKLFGIALLVIGILLLLDNIVSIFDFEFIFPIILIIAGLYLLLESLKVR